MSLYAMLARMRENAEIVAIAGMRVFSASPIRHMAIHSLPLRRKDKIMIKYSEAQAEKDLKEWNEKHPDKKKRDLFCRGECWKHNGRCPYDPVCNN